LPVSDREFQIKMRIPIGISYRYTVVHLFRANLSFLSPFQPFSSNLCRCDLIGKDWEKFPDVPLSESPSALLPRRCRLHVPFPVAISLANARCAMKHRVALYAMMLAHMRHVLRVSAAYRTHAAACLFIMRSRFHVVALSGPCYRANSPRGGFKYASLQRTRSYDDSRV
jgi:hypothetical protein